MTANTSMQTEWQVPDDHPARAMGCPATLHLGCWRPVDDNGGIRDCAVLTLPEGAHLIGSALMHAHARGARFLVVADTSQQVGEVLQHVERLLPKHERISIERAMCGGWSFSH